MRIFLILLLMSVGLQAQLRTHPALSPGQYEISILAFGAKPADPHYNNGPTIMAAMSFAAQNELLLIIPPGTFFVSETITAKGLSGLQLVIRGRIKLAPGANCDLLDFLDCSDILLEGRHGVLDGNSAAQKVRRHLLLIRGDGSDITVTGPLLLLDAPDQGIKMMVEKPGDLLENVLIDGAVVRKSGAEGISITHHPGRVRNLQIRNCVLDSVNKGILFHHEGRIDGFAAVNNTIFNYGTEGITWFGHMRNAHIVNNRISGIDGSRNQLGISGGKDGNKENIIISGNIITGQQSGDGIEWSQRGGKSRNIVVSGNILDSVKTAFEIGLQKTDSETRMENMMIVGNLAAGFTGPGLRMVYATKNPTMIRNLQIIQNILDLPGGLNQQHGLTIRRGDHAGQELQNGLISGNIISGGYYGVYAHSGRHLNIYGNIADRTYEGVKLRLTRHNRSEMNLVDTTLRDVELRRE